MSIPQEHFTRRGNQYLIEFFNGALGGRVKAAHRINFIAKKFQADRGFFSRRPDIQNAAAMGELPWLQDSIRGLVANFNPGARQTGLRDHLIELDRLAVLNEITARQRARHNRAHRGNQNRGFFRFCAPNKVIGGQSGQGLQPVAACGCAPGS